MLRDPGVARFASLALTPGYLLAAPAALQSRMVPNAAQSATERRLRRSQSQMVQRPRRAQPSVAYGVQSQMVPRSRRAPPSAACGAPVTDGPNAALSAQRGLRRASHRWPKIALSAQRRLRRANNTNAD